MVKINERKDKEITEGIPHLIEKYGEIEIENKRVAYDLIKVEREIEICEKCTGLPCAKGSTGRPFIHIVEDFDKKRHAEIRFGVCKYQRAKDRMESLNRKFKAAKIPVSLSTLKMFCLCRVFHKGTIRLADSLKNSLPLEQLERYPH